MAKKTHQLLADAAGEQNRLFMHDLFKWLERSTLPTCLQGIYRRPLPAGCGSKDTFSMHGRNPNMEEDKELEDAVTAISANNQFLRTERKLKSECAGTSGVYKVYYELPKLTETGVQTSTRRRHMRRKIARFSRFQTKCALSKLYPGSSLQRLSIALDSLLL